MTTTLVPAPQKVPFGQAHATKPKKRPVPWRFYTLLGGMLAFTAVLGLLWTIRRPPSTLQAAAADRPTNPPIVLAPKFVPEVEQIQQRMTSLETKVDRVLLSADSAQKGVMDAAANVAKAADSLSRVSENMGRMIADLKELKSHREPHSIAAEPKAVTPQAKPSVPTVSPAVYTPPSPTLKTTPAASTAYTGPSSAAPQYIVERVVYVSTCAPTYYSTPCRRRFCLFR